MKKFTLTLVRHGESTANVSHRLSGNLDVSLTEKGKRELEEMKEKVDYPDADICFSSPLSRCVDTFRILFGDRDVIISDKFREIDFRSYEGHILKSKDEIDQYFYSWVHDRPVMDEETFSDVSRRILPAVLDTVSDCEGKGYSSALVLMHSGVMRVALISLFGMDKEKFLEMVVPNGLGYVITFSSLLPVEYRELEKRN